MLKKSIVNQEIKLPGRVHQETAVFFYFLVYSWASHVKMSQVTLYDVISMLGCAYRRFRWGAFSIWLWSQYRKIWSSINQWDQMLSGFPWTCVFPQKCIFVSWKGAWTPGFMHPLVGQDTTFHGTVKAMFFWETR